MTTLKNIIITCCILLSTTVLSQSKKEQEIDKIMQFAKENQYFNGVIAVTENDQIVYSKGIGYSDMITKEENNLNTLFNLCSISKQFTAMGIMILKERNRLSYDDQLNKYFPELPYKNITIKQMLHHTSGLPDYIFELMVNWNENKTPTNVDAIKYLAEKKPKIKFEPGEKFEYSNTGYMLLASIIEKTSGKEFGQFLKEEIFDKLKMNRTQMYLVGITKTTPKNYAKPYAFDAGLNKFVLTSEFEPYKKQVNTLDGNYGDGGIYSTINDMLLWDNELKNPHLVKKETVHEAFTTGKTNTGKETGYGFGWFTIDDPSNGKIVQHTGGWPGYRQAFVRYIDKKRTLLILRNTEIDFKSIQIAVQNILDGKPWEMPKAGLAVSLALHSDSANSIRKAFENFKNNSIINEEALNMAGYQMMSANKLSQAIEILKINTELFPNSSNAYDSLGEAYLVIKDVEKAKINYKKSLDLYPDNEKAKKVLESLN